MILLLLKASILLAVLYLFYKWVLERESFFAINRIYLIGSLVLCFVLPFLSLPLFTPHQGIVTTSYERWVSPEATSVISPEPASPTTIAATDITTTPIDLPLGESARNLAATPTPVSTKVLPDWRTWVWYAYLFGVMVFLLHFLTQVGSLVLRIKGGKDRIVDTDHTIINLVDEQEPCSFFQYILINPTKYNYETYEEILSHERIHVRQRHSIDLLLAEIGTIILWFNPIAWLFRKEIEKNIEYQTDDLWLEHNQAARERYQMNLLKVASQFHPLTITTNYNQSLLKQRILKMNAKKSNPHSVWKYAFALPVLLIVLLFLNSPNSFNAQESEFNLEQQPPTEVPNQSSVVLDNADQFTIQLHADSMPENAGISGPCEELEAAVRNNDLARVRELLEKLSVDCLIEQNGMTASDVENIKGLLEIGANLQIDPEGQLIEIQSSLAHLEQLADATPLYPIEPPADTAEEEACRALTEAIQAQDLDKIRTLLQNTDPNCSHIDLERQKNYYTPKRSPLVTAAELGNVEIAKLLLEAGAEVEYHGEGEYSSMMAAAAHGHLPMVKYLQSEGAAPTTNMPGYGTPLAMAAKAGSIPVMEYLLDQGVDIDASGLGAGTPLLQAARKGKVEAVRLLISKGANVNVQVDGVGTALSSAVRTDQQSSAALLIAAGADVDLTGAGVGTPLMEAARNNDTEAINLLLKAGAQPNITAPGVGTPLSMAARLGHIEAMNSLLAAGAKTDLAGAGVGTPLMMAARAKESVAVDLLLSKGASLNAQAPGVGTPLSAAAKAGDQQLMEKLIAAKANLDLAAAGVGNPLMMAVRNKDQATVKYLLAQGADPDAEASGVGTPLSAAARIGNQQLLERLIAADANLNLAAPGVGTPLMMAVRNNDKATVNYLLDQGADPNAQAPGVGTALSMAIRAENAAMVELLLAREADPNVAAAGVRPPLFEAVHRGSYELTQLLLENGADPEQQSYMTRHHTAKEAAQHAGHQKIVELLDRHSAK